MKWELFSEKRRNKTIYNKNCYRKKEKKQSRGQQQREKFNSERIG